MSFAFHTQGSICKSCHIPDPLTTTAETLIWVPPLPVDSKENTVLRAALNAQNVSVIPNAVVASRFIPDPSVPDPSKSMCEWPSGPV